MSEWTVKAENGNERTVESRSEAEETKAEMEELGLSCQIHPPDGETDGGTQADGPQEIPMDGVEAEVIDHTEASDEAVEQATAGEVEHSTHELSERSVSDDPLNWVPGDFVDEIDGTPAINRKGFAVLGHIYKIETRSEVVVAPEDTDFEYCRVKAVAETRDGRTYEAHGSAHTEREDDKWLLLEMADTRAKKRAMADATGVGAVAVEELKNELGGSE